jgi:hypothetical protein
MIRVIKPGLGCVSSIRPADHNELTNLSFEVARQKVVLQMDAVLRRLMPTLDLALSHQMIGRTADTILAAWFLMSEEID